MILWISVTVLNEHNVRAGPARLLTLTPLDEKVLSMFTSGSPLRLRYSVIVAQPRLEVEDNR